MNRCLEAGAVVFVDRDGDLCVLAADSEPLTEILGAGLALVCRPHVLEANVENQGRVERFGCCDGSVNVNRVADVRRGDGVVFGACSVEQFFHCVKH